MGEVKGMHPKREDGFLSRDHIVKNDSITNEAQEIRYCEAEKKSTVFELKGVKQQTPFNRHFGRSATGTLNVVLSSFLQSYTLVCA